MTCSCAEWDGALWCISWSAPNGFHQMQYQLPVIIQYFCPYKRFIYITCASADACSKTHRVNEPLSTTNNINWLSLQSISAHICQNCAIVKVCWQNKRIFQDPIHDDLGFELAVWVGFVDIPRLVNLQLVVVAREVPIEILKKILIKVNSGGQHHHHHHYY